MKALHNYNNIYNRSKHLDSISQYYFPPSLEDLKTMLEMLYSIIEKLIMMYGTTGMINLLNSKGDANAIKSP
jgi:hypothetical protein